MTDPIELLKDDDTERALLGALLVEPLAIPSVVGRVRAEDFADERHAAIFAAVLAMGEHADILTVGNELDRRGALAKAGGDAYLAELSGAAPTAMNADAYAATVAELALRRRVVREACTAIAKRAYDKATDAGALVDFAQSELLRAAGNNAGHAIRPMLAIAHEFHAAYSDRRAGVEPGLTTGLSDLDKFTRRMRPGRLLVVGGRPGTGKTALMVQVAAHVALDLGQPVALFTCEMGETEIIERIVGTRLKLDMSKTTDHTDADAARVDGLLDRLSKSRLRVIYAAGWTPARIVAECTRMHASGGIALAVVDYVQLLDVSTGAKGATRDQELTAATRTLKQLAGRCDIPVVIGSQLNRDAANGAPQLHHLREGGIEGDPDFVLLLHQPDESDKAGVSGLVVKNRDGATGAIPLYFDRAHTRFAAGVPKELTP